MHEMSIASSILEAVAAEARRVPGCRPTKVALRIGELAGIDPESLRFCFEALTANTELDGVALEIEYRQRIHRCSCGKEFAVRDYELECPSCRKIAPNCISGDELELAYIEVEEHESHTVGA